MNRIRNVVVGLLSAGGLVLTGLAAGPASATTVAAHPLSQARISAIVHSIKPLPGCADTFVPRASSTRGLICLRPLAPSSRAAANASPAGCDFDYYQNGPYGSSAWANGWRDCVGGGPGNYSVPRSLNDQASAWDSCSDGIFYANQPGTSPSAAFPSFSAGNFPWGSVRNDSLSSAWVDFVC